MRTIMITGCSSGIGEHCALRLKQEGWRVFPTARAERDLESLRERGFEAFRLDYAEAESISSAFASVMERCGGKLDALFNNGAYRQPGAVEDIPTQALREQFEANFFGWHELTNLAVASMRESGGGRIIHCSSILGLVPYRWRGAYNASKHALEGLASTMRMELKGSGIRIVLIEPGPIASRFDENARKHMGKIDAEGSVHAQVYSQYLGGERENAAGNRFELGPEAVYVKLRRALNAPRPRERYAVTFLAHALILARRLLSSRALERLLIRPDD